MRAGCFSSDFHNGSGLGGGVNNDERITMQLCRTLVEVTKRMDYKEREKKRETLGNVWEILLPFKQDGRRDSWQQQLAVTFSGHTPLWHGKSSSEITTREARTQACQQTSRCQPAWRWGKG